jgi:hypothetical protein
MSEDKYKDIDSDVIAFHKLASLYGWTWQDYKNCPYPILKQLLKLIPILESDQSAFLCPCEVAQFKNLLRRYKT